MAVQLTLILARQALSSHIDWESTMRPVVRSIQLLAVIALLGACASTSLQSAWYDTSYRGGPFHRILVVGVGANLTDRRVFEDIFAQQLNTAGTHGIPGYQFLPDDARQNEPGWNEGVTRSGADGLLLVRVLGVDTKTQVVTTMVPGPIYFGPYG